MSLALMAGRKIFILIGGRPPADLLAVLIDEPHGFRGDLPRYAIDHNLLRFRMRGAIKAPDTGVGEAAKIAGVRLGRPEWKPFEDFRRPGSACRPDILDEAISDKRLHGFFLPLYSRTKFRGTGVKGREKLNIRGYRRTGGAFALMARLSLAFLPPISISPSRPRFGAITKRGTEAVPRRDRQPRSMGNKMPASWSSTRPRLPIPRDMRHGSAACLARRRKIQRISARTKGTEIAVA